MNEYDELSVPLPSAEQQNEELLDALKGLEDILIDVCVGSGIDPDSDHPEDNVPSHCREQYFALKVLKKYR